MKDSGNLVHSFLFCLTSGSGNVKKKKKTVHTKGDAFLLSNWLHTHPGLRVKACMPGCLGLGGKALKCTSRSWERSLQEVQEDTLSHGEADRITMEFIRDSLEGSSKRHYRECKYMGWGRC